MLVKVCLSLYLYLLMLNFQKSEKQSAENTEFFLQQRSGRLEKEVSQ
jgi:hypothetical protein